MLCAIMQQWQERPELYEYKSSARLYCAGSGPGGHGGNMAMCEPSLWPRPLPVPQSSPGPGDGESVAV